MEAFDRESIASFQPEDGQWSPPLERASPSYVYRYNVSSDPKKDCGGPCYAVVVSVDGGISFKHYDTGYSDRYDKNVQIAQQSGKNPLDIANEQMYSILHALGEFIQAKHPEQLIWSPMRKTREGAKNEGARGKVYFLWASKNLYPEYVPVSEGEWVRSDVYERRYPAMDTFPDPNKVDEIGGAKKFLAAHVAAEDEARRLRYQREQQQRDRQVADILNDPHLNPNGLRLGDKVMVKDPNSEYHGMIYKIQNVQRDSWGDYGEQGAALAHLEPTAPDPHDPHPADIFAPTLPLRALVKATPDVLSQRMSHFQDLQTRHNPHGLRVNDSATIMPGPGVSDWMANQTGRITGFVQGGVMARVVLHNSHYEVTVPMQALQPIQELPMPDPVGWETEDRPRETPAAEPPPPQRDLNWLFGDNR